MSNDRPNGTEILDGGGDGIAVLGFDRFLGLLLLGSALLLVLGWLMPVMTVETLFIFEDEVSILGASFRLLEHGDILLFIVIVLFTVLFPTAKLIVAFFAWRQVLRADAGHFRAVHWVEAIGKWSMMDVFVVALIVVIIKMSVVSDVSIELGLYVFIIAVVASMLIVRRICFLAHRAAEPRAPSSAIDPEGGSE